MQKLGGLDIIAE